VEGSRHLGLVVGSVNTAVLIVSSLTMAQAVRSAQRGTRRALVRFLALTGLLWRYAGPLAERLPIFFWLYFAMTGLHAVHLTVGVGVVAVLLVLARRGRFGRLSHTPVEIGGLYWHLIDIVWVFLFPLFYLIG